VVQRLRARDALARLADDHRQLGLVVDRAGRDRHLDRRPRPDHRLRHLAEGDHRLRQQVVGRLRAVEAARRQLGRVRAVVQADAEHVAARARQRRVELDVDKAQGWRGRWRQVTAGGQQFDQRLCALGCVDRQRRNDIGVEAADLTAAGVREGDKAHGLCNQRDDERSPQCAKPGRPTPVPTRRQRYAARPSRSVDAPHDEGTRDLLPAVQVAPRRGKPLELRAQLRHAVEHVLDRWRLPGLRHPLGEDAVPGLRQAVAAQGLVSLAGRA
jgi:hypothetical protein